MCALVFAAANINAAVAASEPVAPRHPQPTARVHLGAVKVFKVICLNPSSDRAAKLHRMDPSDRAAKLHRMDPSDRAAKL